MQTKKKKRKEQKMEKGNRREEEGEKKEEKVGGDWKLVAVRQGCVCALSTPLLNRRCLHV